jgi:hypothetical protein
MSALFDIPEKPRWTHGCTGATCQTCFPDLPYNGSSGSSGSDTSDERTRISDLKGATGRRQQAVINHLADQGPYGATWGEIADRFGWHHGTASGALSVLHKAGRIERLKERRGKSKVYCHPRHVNNRDTEPHGGSMKARVGNQPGGEMLTERQADILIDGQRVLVGQVARALESLEGETSRVAAERVVETVADWLSDYRPTDLGVEYCGPLDMTAFILRKGRIKE